MKKILVAYFSYSGNTRDVAGKIHAMTGGDIVEIQSAEPYPLDYKAVVEQAKQELKAGRTPALKTIIETVEPYDMVFIGYPNWCGTIPAPVRAFLGAYDFSGKALVPFCTHEGSGLGRSVGDIARLCPGSALLDGLAVRGRDAKQAAGEISGWLRKVNIE